MGKEPVAMAAADGQCLFRFRIQIDDGREISLTTTHSSLVPARGKATTEILKVLCRRTYLCPE
jgi:hypothetical protein